MTAPRVYLDHNATTPLDPRVLDAMLPYLREHHGNPSSLHWAGRQARDALVEARRQVARFCGARPSEVTFTAGATEALNAALMGAVEASAAGSPHVVATAVEHPAVLEPCRWLAQRGRIRLSIVGVDGRGRLDPRDVAAAVEPETALVCVMRANNELGNLYDTAAVATLVRERAPQALVLVDAVQAAGKIPLDVADLGADLVALSAHKLYGPKGVGALIRRGAGKAVAGWPRGGPQEAGRRAGTENVAAIVGFGAACTLAEIEPRVGRLTTALIEGLRERVEGLHEHGDPGRRLPNTLNLRIDGVEAEELLLRMSLEGIAASSGSACASGTFEPSHVLLATGLGAAEAFASVRLSLGRTNTESDVARTLEVVPALVQILRDSTGFA